MRLRCSGLLLFLVLLLCGAGSARAAGPAVASLSIGVASLRDYSEAGATVTLDSPVADFYGTPVYLFSSSPDIRVPASMLLPRGYTTGYFTVRTNRVPRSGPNRIWAWMPGMANAVTITVNAAPAALRSFAFSRPRTTSGEVVNAIITLSDTVLAGGTMVTLSGGGALVSYRAANTIGAGLKLITVPVRTLPVARTITLTLTVTHNGITKIATVTLDPRRPG